MPGIGVPGISLGSCIFLGWMLHRSSRRSSLTAMKRVFLFLILSLGLSPFFTAGGQARRVQPSPNGKANQREARPEPTITPIAIANQPDQSVATTDDSDEVVKVDTQLVTFPVRVMDRKNRFIGGLDETNFKVYE